MFTISLSAYQAWQRCEQRYSFSYIDKLRQRVKDLAPQRGILLHEYLATYYTGLKTGRGADESHVTALSELVERRGAETTAAGNTAFFAGDEALAQEYFGLMDVVCRIAERYYRARGKGDAERYDVIMVEEWISTPIIQGVESRSIIDLVLRDRLRDLMFLVEHKSTVNVPDSRVRIRDMQTLLYAAALFEAKGLLIDGTLWNYLRTKEPSFPYILKNGDISRAKNLDSTWPVFELAIKEQGLDPADYNDMREHLEPRELEVFFPRMEHVIVASPDLLLEDYVVTAARIRARTLEWKHGVSRPVRSLSRDCTYCPYERLCEAVITGGDPDDLIRLYYEKSGQRDEETTPKEAISD